MSNNKSSVEHFWEQLEEKSFQETEGVNQIHISIDVNEYLALKEQAKAMHKEEIINIVVWCDDTDRRPQQIKIEAEQYYNETYGGKNDKQ
jgi:hypothetical protein